MTTETERAREVTNTEQRAQFLCDRLDELDFSLSMDDFAREFHGHVAPALSRLKDSFASPPTTGGDVTQGRELMFLEILSAMGGKSDSSDWPGSWVNAFCEEHEGRNPDTFNAVEQRGFTQVSHDSDTDHSVVYLTEKGRARLAALATAQAAEGEALTHAERVAYEEQILAAEMETVRVRRAFDDARELARADKDRRIEIAVKLMAARFPAIVGMTSTGMAAIINGMEDFAQAVSVGNNHPGDEA